MLVSAALLPVLAAAGGGAAVGSSTVATRLSTFDRARPSDSAALPVPRARARSAATWCGTPSAVDLTPNAIAGFPVHWIYVVPADGEDRSTSFASAMQTDAEAIDAWWRSQDPTRVPRNDLAPLPCGVQLDISSVRLAASSAQLSGAGRFGALFTGIVGAGFGSPFTKYVVYYDGAVADADVCGQGASDRSGLGVAVVFVQACIGVSTAAVAVHELLHTLGAVPDPAPHNCPAPNDGHTCDLDTDLMFPSVDDSPLSTRLLDPGRDDYYGHSAGYADTQDAPWLVQLDGQVPLTVSISGPGEVSADVPGLRCTQTCATTWNAGTRLTLTATPGAGRKLARWSGGCSGAAGCTITTGASGSVSAVFAPLVFRLTVSIAGRGTVRSSRSGITCRPKCSASLPSLVPVRLTAAPAKGWRFRAWAGACKGRSPFCSVPMNAVTRARAVFVRSARS